MHGFSTVVRAEGYCALREVLTKMAFIEESLSVTISATMNPASFEKKSPSAAADVPSQLCPGPLLVRCTNNANPCVEIMKCSR